MAYPSDQQGERLSKVLNPQPVWTGVDGRKRIKSNSLVQHQGVKVYMAWKYIYIRLGLCDCHTSAHRACPMEAVPLDPLFWYVCTIKLIHSWRWQSITLVLLSCWVLLPFVFCLTIWDAISPQELSHCTAGLQLPQGLLQTAEALGSNWQSKALSWSLLYFLWKPKFNTSPQCKVENHCRLSQINIHIHELNITWGSSGLVVSSLLGFCMKGWKAWTLLLQRQKRWFFHRPGSNFCFTFTLNPAEFCRSNSCLPPIQRLELRADGCFCCNLQLCLQQI